MTDTGIQCCGNGIASRIAWFIGETSRPMCMGIIGTATAVGFLMRLDTGALGIMSALLGALYGAKAAENVQQGRTEAKKNGA
jgi:hypothetical protein